MQSGGEMAVCEYCGMRYSRDRVREMVQEIRGKVEIEGIVKTSAADFEIHAGVLTKYHGKDTSVVIPDGIQEIGAGCFSGFRYLTSVVLPDGLKVISDGAFSGCSSLEKINIPDSVTRIGNENTFSSADTFRCCSKLKTVLISNTTYERLCPQIEERHPYLRHGAVIDWGWSAFWRGRIGFPHDYVPRDSDNDDSLTRASPWFHEIATQKRSIIEKMCRENWKHNNFCQHCGGHFEGVFTKKCANCGKAKDY